MIGEQMNSKKIVLIDGSSMITNAFYGLPSNAADAVFRLIKGILERREADYLAVTFSAGEGYENQAEEALRQQKERLKELSDSLSISVFSEDGYESADLLASLAKKL